jgi:hypothetical protein
MRRKAALLLTDEGTGKNDLDRSRVSTQDAFWGKTPKVDAQNTGVVSEGYEVAPEVRVNFVVFLKGLLCRHGMTVGSWVDRVAWHCPAF